MPDDKWDEILDRALARYSDAEPLAGLEERILARVRTAKGRVGAGWGWAAAACAAAVVAIIPFLHVGHGQAPEQAQYAVALPIPELHVRWSFDARFRPMKKRLPRDLPKLQYFPSRTPMTAEERALARFVRESPDEAAKLFSDWQQNAAEPIKIEPIQIAPLETDDSNTNEPEGKGAGY